MELGLVIMRARVARLPPSRHTLHRRLRLLDRRTGRLPPRTTFLPSALRSAIPQGTTRGAADPTRTPTSLPRSPQCGDASASLSPGPSEIALLFHAPIRKRQEFPDYDAVN